MNDLPQSVVRHLQDLAFGERSLAYLKIDAGLRLVGAGGRLEAYGLEGLTLGQPATQAAPFLEGLLPLAESPFHLPAVELAQGRAADLHLQADGEDVWVALLDVTPERNAARRVQQKAYDTELAREREARLYRQLEATNAELVAARNQLEAQAAELAVWNRTLEARVAQQVAEIERVGRLKRFLAPALAELVVASGNERLLESHRRDIAVLFCDLRGFTPFSERAEPEEVMELLHDYHGAVVPLIQSFEGTLDRFIGDGLIIYFNDPFPCPDPPVRAVRLAAAIREAVSKLALGWMKRGHQIGVGIGIAQGYATLGQIGFEGRYDYSAIGTVINTAARLCDAARDGQILITSRIAGAVAPLAELSEIGPLALKGLSRPLSVFDVTCLAGEDAPNHTSFASPNQRSASTMTPAVPRIIKVDKAATDGSL